MTEFIKAIRDLEIALGSPRRVMQPEEIKKRQANRRSIYLKTAAKAGTRLSDAAIDFRRPGFGIGPEMLEALADQKLKKDLPAGHLLALSDFG
jgi:sialic acid synthase SpsE